MDEECLTGTLRFCERPAGDGCLLMPPSGDMVGKKKASDREVTTRKNFKHPLARRDASDLQLNIDLLDSGEKIRVRTSREGRGGDRLKGKNKGVGGN